MASQKPSCSSQNGSYLQVMHGKSVANFLMTVERKEKMVLSKKIRTYVSDCTTELACSRMCYSSTCVRHVVIHTCRRTTVLLKKKRSKATNPFLTLKLRKNGGNDLLPAVLERPDSTFHLLTFVLKLAILHPEEVLLVNPHFVEHFCRRILGLLVRFVFLALKKTP